MNSWMDLAMRVQSIAQAEPKKDTQIINRNIIRSVNFDNKYIDYVFIKIYGTLLISMLLSSILSGVVLVIMGEVRNHPYLDF